MDMGDRTKILVKIGWKYWDSPYGRLYYSPEKVRAHPRSYTKHSSSPLDEAKEATNVTIGGRDG